MQIICWRDEFIEFEAGHFFVGKTDSKGGPKTTSMCFVMITMISLSFCHISKW